jgi:Na+-transporting NADH:ubiquinone oxidoreductase subunit F
MIEVGLGITLFTLIVVCLVLIILAARSKLIATGTLSITINDEKIVTTPVGRKLNIALADTGIYLPSVCGGVGTCGQCRVRVLEGGGSILPIETARITKREAHQGVRLACQVTIKQDIKVQVPEEIFGVKQWHCTVRSTRNVAPLIKELALALPEGQVLDFRAGSFVEVLCPPYQVKFVDFDIEARFHDEWDRLDLWRYHSVSRGSTKRAYSLANYPDERDIVLLIVRIALPPPGAIAAIPPGVVSSYLFSLKPGNQITIAGPFGHFFASDTDNEMVFIGGGVGMAPMRSHIFDQLLRQRSKRKITFWYGARSLRDLFYVEEFEKLQAEHDNFEWVIALSEPRPEDCWEGPTGFIHQVLYEQYLNGHPAPEDCEYYLCGPPMMSRAVLHMLDDLGVEPDNIHFDDFEA